MARDFRNHACLVNSDPTYYSSMTFTTPMEEAGIIVAELRDQVDVLIGLIHYGKDGEYGQQGVEEIASAYPLSGCLHDRPCARVFCSGFG